MDLGLSQIREGARKKATLYDDPLSELYISPYCYAIFKKKKKV